jgi:predicted hotdog family 3-hydroxylacyl-ACP dehydratase
MSQVVETPIIEGAEVSALLPQKPPMEMVDKLWTHDDTYSVSGLLITSDNVFSKDGFFTEPGLMENIAQTAGLRLGYMVSLMQKNGQAVKPPLGYIGAIKNLIIHELPKIGDELRTEIFVQAVVFEVTLISAKSYVGDTPIAQCEMKIFLKKED